MPTNVKLSDVPVGTVPSTRRPRSKNGGVSFDENGEPTLGWEEPGRCDLFLERFHDRNYDYRTKQVTQSLVLRHVEFARDADLYHRNYLEYLETCWGNHLGIVITPDILWYTVLNELDCVRMVL